MVSIGQYKYYLYLENIMCKQYLQELANVRTTRSILFFSSAKIEKKYDPKRRKTE